VGVLQATPRGAHLRRCLQRLSLPCCYPLGIVPSHRARVGSYTAATWRTIDAAWLPPQGIGSDKPCPDKCPPPCGHHGVALGHLCLDISSRAGLCVLPSSRVRLPPRPLSTRPFCSMRVCARSRLCYAVRRPPLITHFCPHALAYKKGPLCPLSTNCRCCSPSVSRFCRPCFFPFLWLADDHSHWPSSLPLRKSKNSARV
jgi:hypothetical protein